MTYSPTKEAFVERAAQGNLIPVWRELLADRDTPVSAYERLRSALHREHGAVPMFLLESVEGGENIARYSFLGGQPRTLMVHHSGQVELRHSDGTCERYDAPDGLEALRQHMSRYRPVPDPALPPFFGGAVGYIGYDAISQFEPRVPLAGSPGLDASDMAFMITDTIMIFDRVRHTLKVVANAFIEEGDAGAAYDEAVARIDALCRHLATPVSGDLFDTERDVPEIPSRSNVERETFEASVRRAKEYIRAGDVIQTVLSQRFEADFAGDPMDVYRALRSINPSPYMFCLELDPLHLVGASPEVHVKCEGRRVEIRPIAGTRPRSADPAEDLRLEEELLADPKERAEHVMLVDLARNDIGRVCTYGTVQASELMFIERYSHVMHIVSDVVGELGEGRDVYELMRATFPAGTVSGAPKIRAMEIIAELEPLRRGPYSGAVTTFGFTGNLDSCIAIRTVAMFGQKAYVQAGAGIVADSDPAFEYEETRNKAMGMLKALALAKRFADAREEGTS
jgi:anthranilate synthase component 1